MVTFEGIKENLRFIVIETQKQVNSTLEFLAEPDRHDQSRILSRDNYIDNLKSIIETQCYQRINSSDGMTRREINEVRAAHTIAINLERVADYCTNIIQQTGYFKDKLYLQGFNYEDMFIEIIWSLNEIG